jgi:formylglycine-generating enzyme required for sulfatase activity
MIRIPAGSFQMGSPSSESDRDDDEGPVHRVTISDDFYMGKYEVTQAQYEAVMGENPSRFKGANRPVEEVSWNDAVAFCEKLSRLTGDRYRLPTEAEWEYAARAGTRTRFYWGDSESESTVKQYAWYFNNSESKTQPVGQKKPNGWGLYDMAGNVWEWCSDWYGAAYYEESPARDPQGPQSGNKHVLRGGCWGSSAYYLRTAYRNMHRPVNRNNSVGFRVVRDAN